jgi:hypothetical protein
MSDILWMKHTYYCYMIVADTWCLVRPIEILLQFWNVVSFLNFLLVLNRDSVVTTYIALLVGFQILDETCIDFCGS